MKSVLLTFSNMGFTWGGLVWVSESLTCSGLVRHYSNSLLTRTNSIPQKMGGDRGHNVESVLTSYVTLIYLLPHRDNL